MLQSKIILKLEEIGTLRGCEGIWIDGHEPSNHYNRLTVNLSTKTPTTVIPTRLLHTVYNQIVSNWIISSIRLSLSVKKSREIMVDLIKKFKTRFSLKVRGSKRPLVLYLIYVFNS